MTGRSTDPFKYIFSFWYGKWDSVYINVFIRYRYRGVPGEVARSDTGASHASSDLEDATVTTDVVVWQHGMC